VNQPFTIIDCAQRSPEWHEARVGRLTSTGADPMLATIKSGGYSAGRKNLLARLLLERVTGKPQENGYESKAMKDGAEREADALALYEARVRSVRTCGFLRHDELMAGASLDGYVGDFEGIVEAKCPMPATHLEYLRTGTVPLDYYRQITHQLWMCGASWCDFVSFHPDFPERSRLKIVRVPRNPVEIAAYDLAARLFLADVDREVESFNAAVMEVTATLVAAQ
jgi:hypothetical protein